MSYKSESQDMVWKRPINQSMNGDEDDDNVWDDRALIDAYDKAVKQVNQRIADKGLEIKDTKDHNKSVAKDHNRKSNNPNVWHSGQYCRAIYSEDGFEYEAQIVSIDTSDDTCIVKYIGYGNEERKTLKELNPSFGKRCRKQQTDTTNVIKSSESDCETNDNQSNQLPTTHQKVSNNQKSTNKLDSTSTTSSWFTPSPRMTSSQPIIPPPLSLGNNCHLPSDDESLASMLMSWYMSGYHTGYYTALKQVRQQSEQLSTARSTTTRDRDRHDLNNK
ncbi:survival motor neuron protein-like [Oppia nitens]|uniref:survival motor neuron protein-like n=1 Tax=Oppia nitens TaxID=1686743 RepID=UPI0023DBE9B1|nr:survival motor neuron protein-like [Oppia nitens]